MRLAISKLKFNRIQQWGLGLILGFPILYLLIFPIINFSKDDHLDYIKTVLPIHLSNSISLVFYTLIFSLLIAIYLSCVFSLTNIWGKKILKSLSFLPLGIPLYISCFVYEGMFSYSSSIALLFRNHFSIDITKVIHFDSPIQVGFVFALYLSPYLTMPLTKAIESVGASQWPVAKTLGLRTSEVVIKILIPSCIPWVMGGSIIISMETLADFGGVTAFNFDTLTTSIYTAWSGLFSLTLAIKISFILLLLAAMLFFFEYKVSYQKQFSILGSTFMAHPPIHLSFLKKLILIIPIAGYFFLSIGLPLFVLIEMATPLNILSYSDIVMYVQNSIYLSGVAAITIIGLSLFHIYVFKNKTNIKIALLKRIGLFGYTLPGPIIAVSMIGVFAIMREYFTFIPTSGWSLLLTGLLFRFLYIGVSNIENSLKRIPQGLKNSASIYLNSRWKIIKNLYWPFLKKSVPMAYVFIFIEVIKELPITLILKPFGMNTLATKIYEYTTEGEWERASQLSIVLLIVLIPMSFIFNSFTEKRHPNE